MLAVLTTDVFWVHGNSDYLFDDKQTNAKMAKLQLNHLLAGADLIFLKYLEGLIHKIRNQFFFRVNGSKNQIISFQLREQDRFHLKD